MLMRLLGVAISLATASITHAAVFTFSTSLPAKTVTTTNPFGYEGDFDWSIIAPGFSTTSAKLVSVEIVANIRHEWTLAVLADSAFELQNSSMFLDDCSTEVGAEIRIEAIGFERSEVECYEVVIQTQANNLVVETGAENFVSRLNFFDEAYLAEQFVNLGPLGIDVSIDESLFTDLADTGVSFFSYESTFSGTVDVRYTFVPEPAALALLGMGVLGIAAIRRRRA